MKTIILALVATATLIANAAGPEYSTGGDWLKLPEGRATLGNQHGDVAVSSKGDVFVSVQDPQAGLQVDAPDGRFLRNVPGAPEYLHGFVIRRQPDGEFLFGSRLREQSIVKMTLNERGDLFVSEFSSFGRVHRFNRQQSAGGLAGGGTLRAAFLATNPVQGRVDAQTGAVTGPVADLVRELARRLNVPYTITPVPDAAAVIDRVKTRQADIGFLAHEAARAAQVDFSEPYALMANAYAVRADSKIKSSADVDRAGVTVGATRGQSQEIYVSANLKNARVTVFPAMPPNDALAGLLASGELDAFAANRTRMEELARASAKVRVLSDNFLMIGQAIVVDKGDTARVGELNRFIADVRASGFMKASLDRAKLTGVEVAPAAK